MNARLGPDGIATTRNGAVSLDKVVLVEGCAVAGHTTRTENVVLLSTTEHHRTAVFRNGGWCVFGLDGKGVHAHTKIEQLTDTYNKKTRNH